MVAEQISNRNTADVDHTHDVHKETAKQVHSAFHLAAYEQPVTGTNATPADAGDPNLNKVRQWARSEMEASNPQLTAAIAQMDKLNEAIKQQAVKPGSPEYTQALESAVQSYVQVFKSGTPGGIHQQLTAADSMMRQLNLAVENGYIQVDSKAYHVLADAAVNCYSSAAKQAEKDLSNPATVKALQAERTRVQTEEAALQAALGGQQLTPQAMQQLGLTSSDPQALRAALKQRMQDDLTLEDMSRSAGIAHANLGLALVRSAADLEGDAKKERVALGVSELQKAQAADPLTASDANFQKHLGIVSGAAGVDASQLAAAIKGDGTPQDLTTPAATTAPGGVPAADTPPRLPSGNVEVWGPNHTRNQSFQDPYALMQLAEQTNPPQLDKLRLAVNAADSINRQSLAQDMQAARDYITKALQGPNGQAFKDLATRETQDQQQIQQGYGQLAQAEKQLMQAQGTTQPASSQFVQFIQALSSAKTPAELLQIENNTQNSQVKAALQSSQLGRQILGLNNDGIIDKIVKAKADQVNADASMKQLDPNFDQQYKILNFDTREYLSSLTTRKELVSALVQDLGTNHTLSDQQKQTEGAEAVKLVKEMATINPGMLNPANPYYPGFSKVLAALNLTPEQLAKAIGAGGTDAQAAPAAPGVLPHPSASNLPDPLLRMLATSGGDPAKQTPAQKAAVLLDAVQRSGGHMTQDQDKQFQQLLQDATAYETKYGANLEKYRQQLQAESTDLATKLHGNQTFEAPLQALGANAHTIDEVLSQLDKVHSLAQAQLQQSGKLAAIDSLLDQIAKATDHTQQQTLQANLQTAMKQDPTVGKYVSSGQLIQAINDDPVVKKYETEKQNYLLDVNNANLVGGMYGEALLASGDAKDAAKLITAAHNGLPDNMMPSLVNAQHLVQQALGGTTADVGPTPAAVAPASNQVPVPGNGNGTSGALTAPTANEVTAAPGAADLPPGYIPGVTDDITPAAPAAPAPAAPQGLDAQTQQLLQQIPGFQNLQSAMAAISAPNSNILDALKKAKPDFQQAVNAAGSVNPQQQQQFDVLAKQLAAAEQQVLTAKQLTAQGKPDPNPQATELARNVINNTLGQVAALATSLAEPATARYVYAKALNDAAAELYHQANSNTANQAELRRQADAMNAKAIDLLKQIGQVDPTYGYLRFVGPNNLPITDQQKSDLIAHAASVVNGAIQLAQAHQSFDDDSAQARASAAATEQIVANGTEGSFFQPVVTMKNVIGNVPGMSAVNFAVGQVTSNFPVAIPFTAPFLYISSPEMDGAHYTAAAATMADAKALNPQMANQIIGQHEQSGLDTLVHVGADLLSGPGAVALASRLPMPWYVRAGVALAGTLGAEKGLDWLGHKFLGTHELSNSDLAWHTAGSFAGGAIVNGGSLLRGIGEARMLGGQANLGLANTFNVPEGATFRATLREAGIANRTTAAGTNPFWANPLKWAKNSISGSFKSVKPYVSPTNMYKGAFFRPFQTVIKDVPGPVNASGVATTIQQTELAGKLSVADIKARLFWSKLPAVSATGGASWAAMGLGDVHPYGTRADGTQYTWSDTGANTISRFEAGFLSTAATVGFFGLAGASLNRARYASQSVNTIASGLEGLTKPLGRFVTAPTGEVPVNTAAAGELPRVTEYTIAAKRTVKGMLQAIKTPAVPTPSAPFGWQRYAEATLNQGVRVQTGPLVMPIAAAANGLYQFHVWDRIDSESDEQLQARKAAAYDKLRQQAAQQPGAAAGQ